MEAFVVITSIILITSMVIGFAAKRRNNTKNGNAPPSLPWLPFIGSLPFLEGVSYNLHIALTKKSKTYGKLFSFQAGSKYLVVLNGHDLIREALIKNAYKYGGRGEFYTEKYIWPDHGKGINMIPTGENQQRARSGCITVLKNFGFGSRAIMEQRIQEEISHLIKYIHSMRGIAWYPSSILEHSTMNVIFNLMFGKRFSLEDTVGQEVTSLTRELVEGLEVIYDLFPIVTWLPNFKRKIERNKRTYDKFIKFCEKMVEESVASEENQDNNFVKEYLKVTGVTNYNKRDMAALIRDLMITGTETTSGQLNWALILLANHPDVQSRLQKELDSVVPRDRLPSLDDKSGLSYMEAFILEVFRFRTAVPLSVPRLTLERSKLSGYDIPAGTEIIVNIWSAHMDPEAWNEPEVFNPDRFLDRRGAVVNRELMIAFSHGKRSCLGEILARQEMFLFLAALVQQFNILPPEGEVKVKDEMRFIRTLTACEHTMRLVPRDL